MVARSAKNIAVRQRSGLVSKPFSVWVFDSLLRHRWLIMGTIVLCLCAGVFCTSRQIPMFQSVSQILISPGDDSTSRGQSATAAPVGYLELQAKLLTSDHNLEQAFGALRELNLKSLASTSDPVGFLRRNLKTSTSGQSMISLSCNAPVAADSAEIVNAVVDAYRTDFLKNDNQGAQDTLRFFQLEKDKCDIQLSQANAALAQFKSSHPDTSFVDEKGTNLINVRLAKLNERLMEAQTDTLNLTAKSATAAANIPAPVEGATLASDDSELDPAWLESELARTNANIESLSSRGVSQTDLNLVQARAYQTRLGKKISDLHRREGVDQLKLINSQLSFSKTRQAELQKSFDEQKAASASLLAQSIRLTQLSNAALQAKKADDEVDDRLKSLSVNSAPSPQIRVLEKARPAERSTGAEYRMIGYAAAAGLFLSLGMSVGIEIFDNRLRSADEASGLLGLPVLGILPLQRGKQPIETIGLMPHIDPMSAIAEGARRTRAAVFAASRSSPAKTILIASASAKDGKSIFASNLAIVMAQAGGRTLLIDANLRSPSIQNIFDVQRSAGIVDVVGGKIAADRAIRRTPVEGLEVLCAGSSVRSPEQLLNGPSFSKLLRQLGEKYQCIVLDSPAVLSEADARILGSVADLTVMVVRTGSTTRKAADQALDLLLSVGSRVLGVVVNGESGGRPSGRSRGELRGIEVRADRSTGVKERSVSRKKQEPKLQDSGVHTIVSTNRAGEDKIEKGRSNESVDIFDEPSISNNLD